MTLVIQFIQPIIVDPRFELAPKYHNVEAARMPRNVLARAESPQHL